MDKVKQLWQKTNRWHRLVAVFVLGELGIVPTQRQSFNCQDPALSHAFTGDTITWKWLLVTTILLPLAVLLVVENICHSKQTGPQAKRRALRWYKEYAFGILLNLTLVEYTKSIVGAPRPHFFDTCQPLEAETCKGSELVKQYSCSNAVSAHWTSTSNKSFPSGHASMAFHAAIFIAWYLNRRVLSLCQSVSPLSVRVCQCLSLSAAAACAATRLTDRRHHLRDVLAGTGIAVVFCVYTILVLCKNFECAERKQEKPKDESYTNGSIENIQSNVSS